MRIATRLLTLLAALAVGLPLATPAVADPTDQLVESLAGQSSAQAVERFEFAPAAGCTATGNVPVKNYANVRFAGSASCATPTLTQLTLEGQRQGTLIWAQMFLRAWPFNYTFGSGTQYGEARCLHPNFTYRSKATSSESGITRVGYSTGRTLACSV